MNINYKLCRETAKVPESAHETDAGYDLFAAEDVIIECNETKLVPTGLILEIPRGYFGAIVPRSGLSLKSHIRIANAPGTIDSGYRGEVQIIVDNIGVEDYIITAGDKIAQLIIMPYQRVTFNPADELSETDRGEGGFGSSGK